MDAARYDAFISYRRIDGTRVAQWLRNRLQTYRPPKELGRPDRAPRIYLDTSYETATVDFYEENVLPALRDSDWLIVIATPACSEPGRDGGENWVVREIDDFRRLSGRDRPIVAIGADLPDERLPAGLHRAFPNIERVDLRAANRIGPFGFSARARLHEELLKIAAPLWGITRDEMPLLRQEEARRRVRRLSIVLGAAVGLLLAMTLLLVWGMVNLTSARRQLAANHLTQGQNAVELAPAEARLHLVRALEIAEASRLPWLRLEREAATARAWLGVHFRGDVTRILRHPAEVQWARFDPVSGRLATAGSDGTIRLWREGRLVAQSPPQKSAVMWLAFDRTGRRVAFATDHPDGRVAVWDTRSNAVREIVRGELLRPQYGPGHDDVIAIAETPETLRVWSVDRGFHGPPIAVSLANQTVFSPRADLAAVLHDGALTLWQVATGRLIARLPFAMVNTAVAFSGDGRRLAVPVGERILQVFSTESGGAVGPPMEVPMLLAYSALTADGSAAVVVWNADDNVSPQRHLEWISFRDVATGGYLAPPQQVEAIMHQPRILAAAGAVLTVDRREVRVWSLATGLIAASHTFSDQPIDSVVDEKNGLVAVTTSSGSVSVLELPSLRPSRTRIDHAGSVNGVRLSGDGARVVTFGTDRTVRVAGTRRPPRVTVLRQGASLDQFDMKNAIPAAALTADGRVIAASGHGVDLWIGGKGPRRILECNAAHVAVAPGGELAAGCRDRGAWLFGSRGERARRIARTRDVQCLSFSPDGRQLLTCGGGKAWQWDVATAAAAAPAIAHPGGVRNAVVSPDGRWIAIAGGDGTTVIHDRATGAARSPRMATYAVYELAFSADSGMLATSGTAARVWRVPDGKPLTSDLRNPNLFRTVSFSPDGTRLLTGGANGHSQVWDIATSAPDGPALVERGAIWNAEFSADGSRIVTGTFDHRVALWDSASKRPLLPALPVNGSVLVTRFDPDGHRVLIGTAFGELMVWDVAPATEDVKTLRRLAEADSGRTIDETTGLVRDSTYAPPDGTAAGTVGAGAPSSR